MYPGEPHFSYPLPLEDSEVNLGKSGHLDRKEDKYHHLGDFTLRVGNTECHSQGPGQVTRCRARVRTSTTTWAT